MRPIDHEPSTDHDLARVALAVDALTVNTPSALLIHAAHDGERGPTVAEIGLTRLPFAQGVEGIVAALADWTAPRSWSIAGVVVPAVIRTVGESSPRAPLPARVIHLVDRAGHRASRLCVPDNPELSGPNEGFPVGGAVDRCLRRLLGGDDPDPLM